MTNLISPPTVQEAQNASDWVEYLQQAAKWAGVYLTGYITHFFVSRRDSKARLIKAKDEFIGVLADQRAKLRADSRREVFYIESVPVLVGAVFRLQYILRQRQWERLRAVLTDYESQGYKQFDHFQDVKAAFFKDRETSRQRLDGFFDRFERCMDENAV